MHNLYICFCTDVALYTDPEEIYLVRKDGNVIMFDATNLKEEVKIRNSIRVSKSGQGESIRC